jgi:hypothetical protein
MSCPICERRPPKRFCPAKGEKICAICCGEQREVTIDCPSDCPHLVAAHRYEAEHREPPSPETFPYPDVQFPAEFVYERWPVVTGMATTILNLQSADKGLSDGDVLAALEGLAETYRTLGSGILYERPPEGHLARAVYMQFGEFFAQLQKQDAERTGFSSLKEADIFRLFVFLLRVGKQETSGRPRSRGFLNLLRTRFPPPAASAAAAENDGPRIIMP